MRGPLVPRMTGTQRLEMTGSRRAGRKGSHLSCDGSVASTASVESESRAGCYPTAMLQTTPDFKKKMMQEFKTKQLETEPPYETVIPPLGVNPRGCVHPRVYFHVVGNRRNGKATRALNGGVDGENTEHIHSGVSANHQKE